MYVYMPVCNIIRVLDIVSKVSKNRSIELSNYRIERVLPSIPRRPRVFRPDSQ